MHTTALFVCSAALFSTGLSKDDEEEEGRKDELEEEVVDGAPLDVVQ